MRFIVMHSVDAKMEAGSPPDPEIISKMGALVQGSLREGVFLNGAGLHRSARRARIECRGGECQMAQGPYTGKNELIAAFTMISARSIDDAVGHAKTLAAQLGDVDIEIGPVVEPWDLGLMPKPENAPERFLLLTKSTPADERSGNAARHSAAVKQLAASLPADAAILAADSLGPSAKGSRLRGAGSGKRVWVDGPFAESKELIAGFSLLELPSKAEAIGWADRYAAILNDSQVEVRELNPA